MAKHTMGSLLKTLGQILVSDDPGEGLEKLGQEVRAEAKKELGEYSGDSSKPTIVVQGEEVKDGSRTE